jgi:hypothetical protein
MMHQSPEEPPAEIVGRPFALRLAAGLVAAFVVIVIFSFVDRAGRTRLEKATEKPVPARSK